MAADPYWANPDWKAIGAFVGVVAGVATPFFLAWWNGRTKHMETTAKAAETIAERVERIQREQYANLVAERDYQARLAREAEADCARAEAEADDARRDGRAMDDWAHHYRHGWANVTMRFRSLVSIFDQQLAGTMAAERARAILTEIQATMPEPPPTVPLLRDAAATKPPR